VPRDYTWAGSKLVFKEYIINLFTAIIYFCNKLACLSQGNAGLGVTLGLAPTCPAMNKLKTFYTAAIDCYNKLARLSLATR